VIRALTIAAALLTLASADAQERTAPAAAASLSRSLRNANYLIAVRLDPRARKLTGNQTLTWTNISGASTSELRFHLYYNAWRNGESTWMREHKLTSWWRSARERPPEDFSAIDVESMTLGYAEGHPRRDQMTNLTRQMRFAAPDDGNTEDRTVMAVTLPHAIAPGETIVLRMEWTAKIPRPFARTGAIGSYFFFGQWFPKIGVLEPTGTWNCHQFHVGTEFFSDYGVYDVSMTVPRGWPLAATGREQDRRDNPDGTTTHRYHQEDVHDFAWTTSPDYLERRQRFEHPGLPPVDMRLMLQPEHASQAGRHFDATAAALRYYGEWFGPYPYGHITIVDPAWESATGGMEYPTLFTAGTSWLMPAEDTYLEDVTVHEAGHQWWYGLVGTNEFEDAWMDEGINQFANARVMAEAFPHGREVLRFFGGFLPWVVRDVRWDRVIHGDLIARYRSNPTVDIQATPSYRYWPRTSTPMTYAKPSLWLHTLERALGWGRIQQALAIFFEQWKFRHPRPANFFQAVNDATGRDLTPFFDQVYRSSMVFDYGIDDVTTVESDGAFFTDVILRRHGDGMFPVSVLVTFADGEQRRAEWDGVGRWHRLTLRHGSRAVSAQLDPNQVLLLDTSFTNNSLAVEPQAGRAAAKWAAKWMVWLQDQLLTWAFFV
jgi:hypothetical protein